MRVMSMSVLLQLSQQAFVQVNITTNANPAAPPKLDASVIGAATPDEIRRVAEIVLEGIKAIDAADPTPSRVIIPPASGWPGA